MLFLELKSHHSLYIIEQQEVIKFQELAQQYKDIAQLVPVHPQGSISYWQTVFNLYLFFSQENDKLFYNEEQRMIFNVPFLLHDFLIRQRKVLSYKKTIMHSTMDFFVYAVYLGVSIWRWAVDELQHEQLAREQMYYGDIYKLFTDKQARQQIPENFAKFQASIFKILTQRLQQQNVSPLIDEALVAASLACRHIK